MPVSQELCALCSVPQVGVAGLLESVALLLDEGWQPTRTVMLAFGQDEEVGGDKGAGVTRRSAFTLLSMCQLGAPEWMMPRETPPRGRVLLPPVQ